MARSLPLLGAAIVAVLAVPGHVRAQVSFEVASIKPNASGGPASGTHNMPGGRVEVTNKALRDLIRTAFGSNDLEVVGGPDWIGTDRWDIVAAPPADHADAPYAPMLKALLVDRFTLAAHIEQRTRPIYKLLAARSDKRLGPGVHESSCKGDKADCGGTSENTSGIKSGTIDGRDRTLAELGVSLSRYVQRRVFDDTGIEGRYDYHVQWSEELSIFTAASEQLGLKLEAADGPVDVVVIDHVERPTPD